MKSYTCIRCHKESSLEEWNYSTTSDFGSNIAKLGGNKSISGCIFSCPECGGTNEAIHFMKQDNEFEVVLGIYDESLKFQEMIQTIKWQRNLRSKIEEGEK